MKNKDCGCSKKEAPNDFKVQQLTRTIKSECDENKVIDVYPTSIVQAISDPCTGRRLDDMLLDNNHLYLPFRGTDRATLESIPKKYRRAGLYVSYRNIDGINKTYRYKLDDLSCEEFSDIRNWEEALVFDDTYFRPKNLKVEGWKLSFDVVGKDGAVVDTLEVDLPREPKPWLATEVVEVLPQKGERDKIYLVANPKFPGTYNEWIWAQGKDGKEFYSQLGSAVCQKLSESNLDKKELAELKELVNKLKDRQGASYDDTELRNKIQELEEREDKDTVFDPTELKTLIEELKNRRDNDTIYDDTEIRNKIAQLESRPPATNQYDDSRLLNKIAELERTINELKSREDKDTIYNDQALIERIEALEGKTDNDTVFDPSTINDRLERLENKADANKFVNGSEWIDDNHIRLFFNDGSSMDIKRNAPVIRRFNLSVGENLTSTKLNGQYDEGTEVSVTAKTNIRGKRFVKIVDSVAGDITSTSHTFRLTEDRTISAVYEDIPRYNITGEGVRISDSNPYQGENVSINVTIPSGKTLREVVDSVDGNKGAITSYRFAATSDRHIVATFDDIPKPRVYFGFQEGYDADMSLEASKESFAEVENLPYEIDFYPTMPDNANGTHGYFGVAIDKELSPSSAPKLQTLFAGNWTEILSGAIKVTEEQIDGKPYWLIVGTQKTRKFNSGASHFKLKATI